MFKALKNEVQFMVGCLKGKKMPTLGEDSNSRFASFIASGKYPDSPPNIKLSTKIELQCRMRSSTAQHSNVHAATFSHAALAWPGLSREQSLWQRKHT